MPIRVVEFRNYRLRPGVREAFIDYFEEHFLDSQEELGMRVLGQFRLAGEPDRFVWVRGFEDMALRRKALEAFYGGPYWDRWKGPANDMMIEWDRVHLLRPREGAWGLGDRVHDSPPPGRAEPTGVMATFCRAASGGPDGALEERMGAALQDRGHTILGRFVTETAENDFPALPVIQEPNLVVILSLHPDRPKGGDLKRALSEDPEILEVLELEPTDRSGLGRPVLDPS
ncbi:MAG: NIPSNAP family protein [Gemmatimonadota bacterium]